MPARLLYTCTLFFTLHHEGGVPARLLWVNTDLREVPYGVVMPGARFVQQTHLGAHWRAREVVPEREDPSGGRRRLY